LFSVVITCRYFAPVKRLGWCDGLVVSAFDQRSRGRRLESVGSGLSCNNSGQVVHTHV